MGHRKARGWAASAAALLALTLATGASGFASAWGNGGYSSQPSNPDYGTHDGIAELALSISSANVSFLRTTFHTQFLLGTEAPDNPDYVGDSTNHHVYYYSTGQVQDDKSAARARTVYTEALAKLKISDFSGAAFLIGEMSHYISDVGVFGHTMGSGTDWGSEIHHSDYESYFDDIIADRSAPSGATPAPVDAYNATLQLARSITFGDGVVKANVWMDSNYNWSDQEGFVPSASRSLDLAILAVASVIDNLIEEANPAPPDDVTPPADTTPPDDIAPVDGSPKPKDHTLSNAAVVGLAMAAVLAVSGVLLVRTRRRG